MKKTEALQSLDLLASMNIPCSITHWQKAVIENPNYMEEDYDYLVKYSAIPREVHDAHYEERQALLKPLDDVLWNEAPSKGIIYMVQHPEYQAEWDANWRKREAVRQNQREERLRIHRRLHLKYYHEYGITFHENGYSL